MNGVFASEDPFLLTRAARQWGFAGLVVSDWGAVNATVSRRSPLAAWTSRCLQAEAAPTHRSLPRCAMWFLDEAVVDASATRIAALHTTGWADAPALLAHSTSRRTMPSHASAGRSIVLLKNGGGPAVGADAVCRRDRCVRYGASLQGAGSSLISPTKLDKALDEIVALGGEDSVFFAQGFIAEGRGCVPTRSARGCRARRIEGCRGDLRRSAGPLESEGFDHENIVCRTARTHRRSTRSQPNTVVVLSNGGVVALPFAGGVPAIVEGWLLGQAGGGAIADVLYGAVNPPRQAHRSDPLRLEAAPTSTSRVGCACAYGEGLFVGYPLVRRASPSSVAFPFGHGLSYTTFAYGEASAEVRPRWQHRRCASRLRTRVTVRAARSCRLHRSCVLAVAPRARAQGVRGCVARARREQRDCAHPLRRPELAYWHVAADAGSLRVATTRSMSRRRAAIRSTIPLLPSRATTSRCR